MNFFDKLVNIELEEKYFKRVVLVALLLIVISLIGVFFGFGFVCNYKPSPEAITENNGQVDFTIDNVNTSTKYIEITGWSYKTGKNLGYFNNRFVIRNEETGKYKVLKTQMTMVPELFSVGGQFDCRRAGMYAKGFAFGMKRGEYRIFIEYRSDDENFLIDTGKVFKYRQ